MKGAWGKTVMKRGVLFGSHHTFAKPFMAYRCVLKVVFCGNSSSTRANEHKVMNVMTQMSALRDNSRRALSGIINADPLSKN